MRVLSTTKPTPRLLNTVAPEVRENAGTERPGLRARLKTGAFFSGNGRAIFVGIFLGAVVLLTIGFVYERHREARQNEESARKLMMVTASSLSSSPQTVATPAPIIVQISLDLLHVTAISLGHPRLAVINGQQVAEGDRIAVHTPTTSVTVSLQVVKIADGRIDLSDGMHVITARLEARGLTGAR
jgi:multidrug efflux pump subunit AcrA (membrane-fusion protein)